MSNEHEHNTDAAQQDEQPPVKDLKPKSVEAKEAEDVKGGAGEIVITKHVDTPSQKLF